MGRFRGGFGLATTLGFILVGCTTSHPSGDTTGTGSSSGGSQTTSGTTGSTTAGGTGSTSGTTSGGSTSGGFQCNEANFTVACGQGDPCPSHSRCLGPGSCACDTGSVDVDCEGRRCELTDAGCAFPNWTCALREPGPCGPINFSFACDAGGYCPANGRCLQGGCACQPGYVSLTCEGAPCGNGAGCMYPDYWCSPAGDGYCGMGDFTVPCAGGVCPANSVCQGGYCVCSPKFIMINCVGVDCSDPTANCIDPNYWCAPIQPGHCGPQNFTVDCGDGINACPTHATCQATGCLCDPGFQLESCHGGPCMGQCKYLQYWCAPH